VERVWWTDEDSDEGNYERFREGIVDRQIIATRPEEAVYYYPDLPNFELWVVNNGQQFAGTSGTDINNDSLVLQIIYVPAPDVYVTACAQESWESYNAAGLEAHEQARYAEAEELYLAALEEAEQFGDQDPRLADSLNNLAFSYHGQGKYVEAEPLYQRALEINEALGREDPSTAINLNNLAELYLRQGKYAESEPLYQRALAIYEKILGPDDPKLANLLEDYAALLRQTGRNEEADRLEERARAIRAKER